MPNLFLWEKPVDHQMISLNNNIWNEYIHSNVWIRDINTTWMYKNPFPTSHLKNNWTKIWTHVCYKSLIGHLECLFNWGVFFSLPNLSTIIQARRCLVFGSLFSYALYNYPNNTILFGAAFTHFCVSFENHIEQRKLLCPLQKPILHGYTKWPGFFWHFQNVHSIVITKGLYNVNSCETRALLTYLQTLY